MLGLIILIVGAALPSALLILWIRKQDKAKPEPVGLIGKSVLFGCLSTLPAIVLEFVIGIPADYLPTNIAFGLLPPFWTAFITAAFVEESVKYFFFKRFLRNPAFDEVMDGIVYAVCISLGFAFAENILYGQDGGTVLLVRAFTAVPMHTSATGIMGYWQGRAKFAESNALASKFRRRGYWSAIIIHGLYDFFLMAGGNLIWFAFLVLFISVRMLRSCIKSAKEIDFVN